MGRFEIVLKEHINGGILKIIIDRETGVHYLVSSGMGVSGMIPLLDEDGNPIIKHMQAVIFSLLLYYIQSLAFSFSNST